MKEVVAWIVTTNYTYDQHTQAMAAQKMAAHPQLDVPPSPGSSSSFAASIAKGRLLEEKLQDLSAHTVIVRPCRVTKYDNRGMYQRGHH